MSVSPRDEINSIIIQADEEIRKGNVQEALKLYQSAIEKAQKIDWQDRVMQINQLIEEHKKHDVQKQQELVKKKKIEEEIQRKKEEERKLDEARQRMGQRKDIERQQKMDALKKKKEQEEKTSNEGYNFLEQGSNALKSNSYEIALKHFKDAQDRFKSINWGTEVNRIQELIDDANEKFQIALKKLKDEEERAKKISANFETHKTQIESEGAQKQKETNILQQKQKEIESKSHLAKQMSEKAFNLIDQGNKFLKINDFTQALSAFRESKDIFEKIGWTNEADKVLIQISASNDKQKQYELMQVKQKESLKKKEEDQLEIEKQAEAAKRLQEMKFKGEKEIKQKEDSDRSYAQSVADEVYASIDAIEKKIKVYDDQARSGKLLELICIYPDAIKVYEKGQQGLRDIGWLEQSNRLGDGARAYQEKFDKDTKLRDHEKKRIEEQKKEQLDMENEIEQSQRLQRMKEDEKKKAMHLEQQKTQAKDKVQDECLTLLDQAKILVDKKNFPESIKIYQRVLTKYKEIGWEEGVRIALDTLTKVQHDYEMEQRNKLLAEKTLEEQQKAQKELDEKIKSSHEEEEKKRLEAQKKLLERKMVEDKNKQLQNNLLTYLEQAGQMAQKEQFDQALDLYNKSLELAKQIESPLKYQQISDLIQDLKARKALSLKKQQQMEDQKQRVEAEKRALEEKFAKEDAEKKARLAEGRKKAMEEQQKSLREKQLSENAYKYLDDAETLVKADKLYLALNSFHKAFSNFNQINWIREATTTKTRLVQVFETIDTPIIDLTEFLSTNNFDNEDSVMDLLNQCILARKLKKFSKAFDLLKDIGKQYQNMKWVRCFNSIAQLEEKLKEEQTKYEKDQAEGENKPSSERAMKLLDLAKVKTVKLEFEEAIKLGEEAVEIFKKLGLEREASMVTGEIIRWKHQGEKHEDDIAAVEVIQKQKQEELLNEEESRNKIIEDRKKQRREERKKIRED